MPEFAPHKLAIAFSDADLEDLRVRLAGTRFVDAVEGAGWDYGMDLEFLKTLVAHWGGPFDWRREEARLNGFDHFTVEIDGETVHYVHARGQGGKRVPILLANGWPSNFVELLPLVPLLTQEQHGVSFDVVIASLPGYGFSGRPKQRGMNLSAVAPRWVKLMTGLGYEKFLVSSSDLGAGVALALVRDFPQHILGGHWANVYSEYPRPEAPSEAELDYFAKVDQWRFTEAAYAMEHGTKPATLAAGLNDSPAGLAAWIVEKFHGWSDLRGGDLESVYGLDTLCSILTVYWMTQTISSSVRLYYEAFRDQAMQQPTPLHSVKQAVIVPPGDSIPAPREWGERNLQNLVRWTEPAKGGHFPALEIPRELAADIRGFWHDIA
jgi:pimeloyl-ACP methyl ester carboxylesterase